MAFYLIFFLAFYLTFFLAFFLAFYLTFFLAVYLTSNSDILSGISLHCEFFSDILSGIYSDIRSGVLSAFGSKRAPQHLELAIWCPVLTPQCRKKTGVMGASEARKQGVAPLLKSRDPHWQVGKNTQQERNSMIHPLRLFECSRCFISPGKAESDTKRQNHSRHF